MSDIKDQGPQNLAQAEAEALRALEAGAWRVWQAGSGPLPAAYARWCAAEIGLATAALRERAEKAEADRSFILMANYRLVAERDSLKAEVAQLKEGSKAAHGRDLRSEVARVCDLLDAKPYTPRVGDAFTWDGRHFIFSDPAAPAGSYVPRVGDVVRWCWDAGVERIVVGVEPRLRLRTMAGEPIEHDHDGANAYAYIRRATPAERAAAGLAPEAPAPADGSAARFDEAIAAFDRARAEWREAIKQPQVLPEHLAYIEASASAWIDLSCASEQATKAANALRAAVARRDGGQK